MQAYCILAMAAMMGKMFKTLRFFLNMLVLKEAEQSSFPSGALTSKSLAEVTSNFLCALQLS